MLVFHGRCVTGYWFMHTLLVELLMMHAETWKADNAIVLTALDGSLCLTAAPRNLRQSSLAVNLSRTPNTLRPSGHSFRRNVHA